jgi:hypothetical protein
MANSILRKLDGKRKRQPESRCFVEPNPPYTYTRCRGIMSDSIPEGQGLDNSVSSQLAGNDVANLYGVINRDK